MADDRDYRPRDERFRDHDRARGPGGGRDHGSRGESSGGRGFFERAGDEISSWFGDEEAERRREQDDRSGGYGRDEQGRGGGRPMDRAPDRDSSRDRGRQGGFFGRSDREPERERGGMPERERGRFFAGSDRDEQRYGRPPQFDREQSDRRHDGGRHDAGGGRYPGGEREEYRPLAGDYGRGSSGHSDRGEPRGPFAGSTSEPRGPFTQPTSEPRGVGAGSMIAAAATGGSSQNHDPHYQEWRQRQIDQLDRDYEDYRREHQSKFDNDFSGWRTQRQTKRQMLGQIREQMQVVGSDEQEIGIVDKVQGDKIILTRNSQGGIHKSLECTAIDRVEGNRVILAEPADSARRSLVDEGGFQERNTGDIRGSAQGGYGEDGFGQQQSQQQGDGPHILERSFSGTYPDESNR